jgi:AraC family transcriptional regulator of adaptative response/methylated-DNA-[protein]-cysteine methyltransferase
MPDPATMFSALVERDASFEGLFVAAIRTTGIFCRPTCPARKPRPENVEFFPRAGDALAAGYRPCLRCRPMEANGEVPDWLKPVLRSVDADPLRRWTGQDLRDAGVDPARARRWFQAHHGMTFMAYLRARRLGQAFSRLKDGARVTDAAFDSGFESLSGFCDAFRRSTGRAPSKSSVARTLKVTQFPSPLGPLVAAGDENAVHLLEFWDRRMLETQFTVLEKRMGAVLFPGSTSPLEQLRSEVEAYFAGDLTTFKTPIALPGTKHQEQVWKALIEVPYGKTLTYGQLAKGIGRPTATRPVARAVGENRLAIIIPCHRIVGHDGQLTGYGGGLWRKRFLLDLEQNRNQAGS